jgi:hypothetical protein
MCRRSVPPVVAGGYCRCDDPPATAGGTDLMPCFFANSFGSLKRNIRGSSASKKLMCKLYGDPAFYQRSS